MSTLSYGLNITKKPPQISTRPLPARRKTIFDDDSGPEDGPDDEDNTKAIDTIGGLTTSVSKAKHASKKPPLKPHTISQYGDFATNHSTARHAKSAQVLDPSVYDYDSVYDSLHAKPPSSTSSTLADQEKRPKYMSNLLAAAEVRKRDQLRAKEKMLAKEREAEGEEFADKEKFVTGAYKRQQEEMKRLEAEEVAKEKEAEERRRRKGAGLKGLYKNMLEKDEAKHAAIVKAVEEAKLRGPETSKDDEKKKEKEGRCELDLAREKGAIVNEDGQVVDKRQLLSAGLNASSASKPTKRTVKGPSDSRAGGSPRGGISANRGGSTKESARERETRLFEEQLLGKRGYASDDGDDSGGGEVERATKSRRLEDEILGLGR